MAAVSDLKRCTYILLLLCLTAGGALSVCSRDDFIECLKAAGLGDPDVISTGFPNETDPTTFCREHKDTTDTCLTGVSQSCGSSEPQQEVKLEVDLAQRIFRHICTEAALPRFIKHEKCLNKVDLQRQIEGCANAFERGVNDVSDRNQLCHLIQNYRACSAISTNATCGEEAASFLDEVLGFSLEVIVATNLPSCDIQAPLDNYCYPSTCENGEVCRSPEGNNVCSSAGSRLAIPTMFGLALGAMLAFLLSKIDS